MAKAEELVQQHVSSELERLSEIHQTKMVSQLVELAGVPEWNDCLSSIPFDSGNIDWALYSPSHENKRGLEDLIHVEFVLDENYDVPVLDVLDGFVIRQDVAHRRMKRFIENPRVLLFLGSLTKIDDDGIASFDGMQNSKGTVFLDLIKQTSPDVILTSGRASHSLVEILFQCGITLLFDVNSDTLIKMKSMFEAERYTSQNRTEATSGPDFAFGVCTQFIANKVQVAEDDSDTRVSGDESSKLDESYSQAFCKIVIPSACFKTVLVQHNSSLQFAKLGPIIKWLMLSTCWKYLEVSFLMDFFSFQGSRARFESFLRRVNYLMQQREREIGTVSTSMFSGYMSLSKVTNTEDVYLDCRPKKFCTATFCFNPEKQFLCEAAHQHCVDVYGLEDLSIVEYFMAASPKNIKCKHPDCGFDVCSHKRAFVSNQSSVTISSVYIDEMDPINPTDIFMWVENGSNSCKYRLKMSRVSVNLSISHLLSLIICGGLFSSEDDSTHLCVMKGNLIVKFSYTAVTPYSFVLPNRSQSIKEHAWIQDDLRNLQSLLQDLQGVLSSPGETDPILEQIRSIVQNLEREVLSLSDLFRAGARINYDEHLLLLDSLHYLVSFLLSVLTADYQTMRVLGVGKNSGSLLSDIDAAEQDRHSGEPEAVGAPDQVWSLQFDDNQFSNPQKGIMADLLKVASILESDEHTRNSLVKFSAVSVDIPKGLFFWDGDHWRFHHGDRSCSIISCFLSSGMYHKFLDTAMNRLNKLHQGGSWPEILSFTREAPETCQIVLGDSKFESYCAIQFHALRELCISGGNETFLVSMRNCQPWSATGGKSNAFFAKTSDDKFIVKQISKSEKQSFIDFSDEYFHHVGLVLENSDWRSGFAKIFGMFRVSSNDSLRSRNDSIDFIVMENVFHSRNVEQAYDLKGFPRELHERGNPHQAVLVDGNLRSNIQKHPIFVSTTSMESLIKSMKFDTDFLGRMNVMDYSLLIGIDTSTKEIIVGIVDYLRRYTLDKHIESWVKLLGAAGEKPTVISPPQYADRFREGIESYFTAIPCNF